MNCRNPNPAFAIHLFGVLLTMLTLNACVAPQTKPMRLLQPSTTLRQIQSRRYEMPSAQAILSASIDVLQDMNYTIDEINTELGILTASKSGREIIQLNSAEVALTSAICLIFTFQRCDPQHAIDTAAKADPGNTAFTLPEVIVLTLMVTPDPEQTGAYIVRLSMQSIVEDAIYHHPPLKTAKLVMNKFRYQAFFEKLSKSTFLETHL